MAFNVNSLPDYVEVKRDELITKSMFLGSKSTLSQVNLYAGVKFKEAINVLDTDPVLQARACGWNADGDVNYTQEYIEVSPIKVNMELCEEDLRKKFMNDQIKTAAGAEVLPFEERTLNDIAEKIAKKNEVLVWNGSTGAGDLFDGFLTRIQASSEAVDAASAASDVYGKIVDVYTKIKPEILDKAVIFIGEDDFRSLCLELVTKNLYHYQFDEDVHNLDLVFPGTSTHIVGVWGLNGTHAIVAADPEYLIAGTDLEADAREFDVWYSKDNQEFRIAVKYNLGTQIIFPDYIVYDI